MGGIGKELIRWIFGGGALAAATFLGTTAYQQGQLQIERERNLRDFLARYVELATKGTLDERIRFVQYWESLDVARQIGVDLTMYRKALRDEFNEADRFAAQVMADSAPPKGRGGQDGDKSAPLTAEPPAVAVAPNLPPRRPNTQPQEKPVAKGPSQIFAPADALANYAAQAQQAQTQQEAYFASRSQTIAKLIPGAANAPDLERRGFEALLANDIRTARDAFRAAEKAWPEYHNVAEIARTLDGLMKPGQSAVDGVLEPAAVKTLYRQILRDYSWGMPPDLKTRMQALAQD